MFKSWKLVYSREAELGLSCSSHMKSGWVGVAGHRIGQPGSGFRLLRI